MCKVWDFSNNLHQILVINAIQVKILRLRRSFKSKMVLISSPLTNILNTKNLEEEFLNTSEKFFVNKGWCFVTPFFATVTKPYCCQICMAVKGWCFVTPFFATVTNLTGARFSLLLNDRVWTVFFPLRIFLFCPSSAKFFLVT